MKENKMYPNYGLMLDPSDRSVNYDKKNFGRWEDGKITTRTCWTRFRKNNGINGKTYRFNEEWFVEFLNSLGYFQGGGYGRED